MKYTAEKLNEMLVSELKSLARQLNIPDYEIRKKQELVAAIIDSQDRKSVVQGKSVDLGGRRIIKKNVYTKNENAIILIGLFFFKQKTAYEITR